VLLDQPKGASSASPRTLAYQVCTIEAGFVLSVWLSMRPFPDYCTWTVDCCVLEYRTHRQANSVIACKLDTCPPTVIWTIIIEAARELLVSRSWWSDPETALCMLRAV